MFSYGYACNDENIPDSKGPICKDMKVGVDTNIIIVLNINVKIRFCCAKKMRAQWGQWEEW